MEEKKLALKVGLGAGILSILCCVGPVIPIVLGIGGASAFLGLTGYEPWFLGAGVLLMAAASVYAVWKRNKCCTVKNRWKDAQLVGLIFGSGIAAYLVLNFVVAPLIIGAAERRIDHQLPQKGVTASETNFVVEGMVCQGCAVAVKQALVSMPGVLDASVDWKTGLAKVRFNPKKTDAKTLLSTPLPEQYTIRTLNSSEHLGEKKQQT